MRNILLSMLVTAVPLLGDTVFLINGTTIDGIIQARHKTNIELQIGKIGRIYIDVEAIASIEKNDRDGSINHKNLSMEGKRKDVAELEDAVAKALADKKKENQADQETQDVDLPKAYLKKSDVPADVAEEVKKLLYDLQRSKSRYRVRAERKLLALGEPCVPFLKDVAGHENPLVRSSVLRILEKTGNRSAIPVCLEMLADENEFVREQAAKALKAMTGEKLPFQADAPEKVYSRQADAWHEWYRKDLEREEEAREQAALAEKLQAEREKAIEKAKKPRVK